MRKTVLHDRHVALGARVIDFHGWLLPVQYEGVLAEHRHCRSAAVVFDTSHMGQFLIQGPAVAAALSAICTQNAQALPAGRCRYGFLLNERGGILDDTILMRLGEDEFLLVVNAGTLADDLRWLQSHLFADVELTDLSAAAWGKIDLQGPASFDVLSPLVDTDLTRLPYFGVTRAVCEGRSVTLSRTGYTGELGYEIMAAGDDLGAVFDRLVAAEAVRPAGLGARDSLRLEMGYPLYGQDISPEYNPHAAGLVQFVSGDHEFLGSAALRAAAQTAPTRTLAAFKAASRRRANPGNEILRDGEAVGVVTSGAFSPSLDVSIAMGYVRTDLAEPGTELTVQTDRAEMPVIVGEMPLYRQGTCRKKLT